MEGFFYKNYKLLHGNVSYILSLFPGLLKAVDRKLMKKRREEIKDLILKNKCNLTAKMEVFLLSIIILSDILFIRAAIKTSFMLDMPALRQMMPYLFIRWIIPQICWDVHTTRENNANNEMNSC